MPAYAAYEAAMMKYSLDLAKRQNVNLRGVVTWAFLFDGQPYFEGFRSLATNGIHKPVLNAYKMLGQLTGDEVPLISDGALDLDEMLARGSASPTRHQRHGGHGRRAREDPALELPRRSGRDETRVDCS